MAIQDRISETLLRTYPFVSGSPPREKLLREGAAALTDFELLSVIVGTGGGGDSVYQVVQKLLTRFGEPRALSESHPRDVLQLSGLGSAKVARIFASLELGRRVCRHRWKMGEPFYSSRQVFLHYHQQLRDCKNEVFLAVFLDARNRLIGEEEISRGSLVASIVHPREVFRPAIRCAAAALICVHNHPSGDPRHSGEDVAITRRLLEVGDLIGIRLVDHVIIGDGCYSSFVDERIAPFAEGQPRPPGGVGGGR